LVTRAVEGKAQKVDRLRTFTPSFASVPLGKATELDELGLARLQCEAKLPQALAKGILDAKRIRAILEAQHEIIDIAHQVSFTAQTVPDHALEPEVEHVVQVEIAQQDADRPPLRCPLFARMDLPILQDAGFQPAPYQAVKAWISDSMLDEAEQPYMV
jgi:hypothetical protein